MIKCRARYPPELHAAKARPPDAFPGEREDGRRDEVELNHRYSVHLWRKLSHRKDVEDEREDPRGHLRDCGLCSSIAVVVVIVVCQRAVFGDVSSCVRTRRGRKDVARTILGEHVQSR